MKFGIWGFFFENLSSNLNFHSELTKIRSSLLVLENLCIKGKAIPITGLDRP